MDSSAWGYNWVILAQGPSPPSLEVGCKADNLALEKKPKTKLLSRNPKK